MIHRVLGSYHCCPLKIAKCSLKQFWATRSDTFYGGTPISPMGRARHSYGGIGDIPKTLGEYCHAPRSLSSDPRSLGLRKR